MLILESNIDTYFKNVDLCDLPSILKNGILSLKDSGNDNWLYGNRANNSEDVVYLFKPIGYQNSFVQYGVALLEVEVDAIRNEMLARDVNRGKYVEYICNYVPPEDIIAVYIPKIFKNKVSFNHPKIKWVDMEANYYDEYTHKRINCMPEILKTFADTAKINDSTTYNYFRGILPNGVVLDLYDIHYDI